MRGACLRLSRKDDVIPNRNAERGARWERDIRDYLRAVLGKAVIRPRQEGYVDVGDLHASPWALQAKDEARLNLSGYVNDAEKQAAAAGEPFSAAVVKRRRYSTEKGYVVMTLATFRDSLVRLRRAETLLARHAPEVFYTEHLPEPAKTTEQEAPPSQT